MAASFKKISSFPGPLTLLLEARGPMNTKQAGWMNATRRRASPAIAGRVFMDGRDKPGHDGFGCVGVEQ